MTDFDYIHKLNDSEKQFMNNFLEEYVNANMNHSGKILHKTKALKKSCYDRNNARNRDILSKAKATGRAVSLSALTEGGAIINEEDKLIFQLDNKIKL